MGAPVLLLLDPHDVRGAAIGGEEIGAVLALEELVERGDAREETDEIVFGGPGGESPLTLPAARVPSLSREGRGKPTPAFAGRAR